MAGQVALALELEELWNGLAARLPFALLCGYPAGLLAAADDQQAAGVQHVCHLHTAVAGPSPGRDVNGRSGAVRRFPGDLASAREARHFVVAALGQRAQGAGGADAAITAGELAANAVRHARSPFTVTVSCLPPRVRISVQDQGPAQRVPLVTRPGHGLHMVAQMAARWAVEPLARREGGLGGTARAGPGPGMTVHPAVRPGTTGKRPGGQAAWRPVELRGSGGALALAAPSGAVRAGFA